MVCFDAKTRSTYPISEEWKKAMIDFEGRGDLSKNI
jgi:acyl-CoA thioester hydrolase